MMNITLEKKLQREATGKGLKLIGKGSTKDHRRYRFIKCSHEREIQTTQVRNSTVSCIECSEKQLLSEAKGAGLKLVGEGDFNGYRKYQFRACGHEQQIQLAKVRQQAFKCVTCIKEKHEKEAHDAGLEILGKGKNYQYRAYRFIKCGHKQEITTGAVRKKTFRCDTCLQENLRLEAQDAGLELIGAGKDSNHRLYRFEQCEHEQNIQTAQVRLKNFRCGKCIEEKRETSATNAGLKILGRGRTKRFLHYRFIECGHEQQIQINSVELGTFKCGECFRIKLEEEAKNVGLTIIGLGKTANRRKYKFQKCGHEQEIQTSRVRSNTLRCDTCQQNKLRSEANLVGLTLIGRAKRASNYREYKFESCKHTQEIRTDQVRNNTFLCNTCEETDRDLPSNLYLLKVKVGTFEWLKLGYAKVVDIRVKAYRLVKSAKVELICCTPFDTGRNANLVEAELHKKYKKKRISPNEMKKYHTVGGHSECYPIDLLEDLREEVINDSYTRA